MVNRRCAFIGIVSASRTHSRANFKASLASHRVIPLTYRTPMAQPAHAVPTIDLSIFVGESLQQVPNEERIKVGQRLVETLHRFGFIKITGHGFPKHDIDEALAWTKRLFDLSLEEKMKAPHPPGPMPHRGYSSIGKEKVYSQTDVGDHKENGNVGQSLRKISDFKESYEIGSEQDPVQQNIWLPEDVLPGFRGYMTTLYDRLLDVSKTILGAIAIGLLLEAEEYTEFIKLISDQHCQLRLLHYPEVTKEKLQNELLARLPAHNDWGTMTLLFQDERGGLELKDPRAQEFLSAEPEEGALVLNIGDMLQRFTNDYFVSALHRVTIPDPDAVSELGIPARYSIPFFVAPDFSYTIATLERFITADSPPKYNPVRFDEYGSLISKYQYQDSE
ncbi:Clavaminate synthase-like protein [Hypoxylon sp. FL1150]|nr:Clavaminate synthase-like protein [Hypoxylon sp. FL1150]